MQDARKTTNEIIEAIHRSLALFMVQEDLSDYELAKIQDAQIIINRHKKTDDEPCSIEKIYA